MEKYILMIQLLRFLFKIQLFGHYRLCHKPECDRHCGVDHYRNAHGQVHCQYHVVVKPHYDAVKYATHSKHREDHHDNCGNDLRRNVIDEVCADSHEDAVFLCRLSDSDAGVVQKHISRNRQKDYHYYIKDKSDEIHHSEFFVKLGKANGKNLRKITQGLTRNRDHHRKNNRQKAYRLATDRGQQLDKYVLRVVHGQSEGQITLGGVHIFVKPHHRHDHRKHQKRKARHNEHKGGRNDRDIDKHAIEVFEEPEHSRHHANDQNDRQKQRKGAEIVYKFVFEQLLYHLNTSLKSASTLIPRSSRISSTVL